MKRKVRLGVFGLIAFLGVAGALVTLVAQQPEETGPPQFTTIPIHSRMLPVELKNGHVVYVPPRVAERIEEGGGRPPGGG